jgi:hypothetical protein
MSKYLFYFRDERANLEESKVQRTNEGYFPLVFIAVYF